MGQDEIFIKGVRYRRIGTAFEWMAEAARFAKLLREEGHLAVRRGYCVYSAPGEYTATADRSQASGG